MRKKVLIAEQSDAIRSIAESILHQNGFDVISCSAGDKAKALIISEQPNLVIVGADIRDSEGSYLYDSLCDNKATSSIPLLLIEDPNGNPVPYPPEVVLPRPFEPSDFMNKVSTFIGAGDAHPGEKITESSPFGEGAVDDELLDAALGIDEIEVEESEVMNQTWTSRNLNKAAKAARKDAFDIVQDANADKNDVADSGKVESLMIRDEQDKQKKADSMTESTKIQIDNDQYGMTASHEEAEAAPAEPKKDDHDYDWFLNEMQKDGTENKPPAKEPLNETDPNLKVTSPRDTLEPIGSPQTKNDLSDVSSGGVDEFISEFKKEMQQISTESDQQDDKVAESKIKKQFESELGNIDSEPLRPAPAETVSAASPKKTGAAVAEQPIAAIDPEEIRRMCTYLVELLAERLAKSIADKIDREEIYDILREELPHIISAKK
jgi:hypothetical protein